MVTVSKRQLAPSPATQDTQWFWEIVDRDGLGNVPSDERGALVILVLKAAAYDKKQQAHTECIRLLREQIEYERALIKRMESLCARLEQQFHNPS